MPVDDFVAVFADITCGMNESATASSEKSQNVKYRTALIS